MHTTDRDYADMVNPHIRAEREAYGRGFQAGVVLCGAALGALMLISSIAGLF